MRRTRTAPRPSLKWRRWRHRLGPNAPRLAVRTHVSWHWRLFAGLLCAAAVAWGAVWLYAFAQRQAGLDRGVLEQERTALHERVVSLEKEVVQLRSLTDAGESRMQIERTAQQQMAQQLRALEAENGQLKEDLSVFENLARQNDGNLSIHRVRLEPEVGQAGHFRYRMLLVMQGGKDRAFRGSCS